MNGASDYGSDGAVSLKAFLAGNDMLLMPKDVRAAKKALKAGYTSGRITEERLAYSVKKILMAKYKVGYIGIRPSIRPI